MRTFARGIPSSVDLLRTKAGDILNWLQTEVADGEMRQVEILGELNARLATRGIAPISRSSLNRWILAQLRGKVSGISITATEVEPIIFCPRCGQKM